MTMKILSTIDALREQISDWRKAGERIAFVPTMGNLHNGHLKLVDNAKTQADHKNFEVTIIFYVRLVVVSYLVGVQSSLLKIYSLHSTTTY